MYLKKIAIKNMGPIKELAIDLPFSTDGNPKPIVFVGGNGTGKTILGAQIMDGLYEISCKVFDNTSKYEGLKRNFYKISGAPFLTLGKQKGFSALIFSDSKNNKIEYLDPIGDITKEDLFIINEFSLGQTKEKNISKIDGELKTNIENDWNSGAYFYEPAYRYEEPFWKNNIFNTQEEKFENKRYSGVLNKEIEIITSNDKNKNYLMNLVLDYSINNNNLDQSTWNNINLIIKEILNDKNARFGIGPRGFSNRISVVDDVNGTITPKIPNIDQLSLGESVLLNTFINIIRHGDSSHKSVDQIEGIVIIDEIDQHLHIQLQEEVLPILISKFPKIQFILTSHSPLFLLGMEKVFGKEGFEIRNMPDGELITTERFSEFENAYSIMTKTEKFDNNLKNIISNKDKPIVYVEGPTDVQYIQKAYKLYNKSCENFYIEIIGENTPQGTVDSNNDALEHAEIFLKHNTNIIKQKIILLNDPEEDRECTDYKNLLYVRKMEKFVDHHIEKGIENLFENGIIEKARNEHPELFLNIQDHPEIYKIEQGQKQKLCNWRIN